MSRADLYLLLSLFMVSDPWPLTGPEHVKIESFLDRASQAEGFENWVVAFHEMGTEFRPAKGVD